jgi:hypothetical protein
MIGILSVFPLFHSTHTSVFYFLVIMVFKNSIVIFMITWRLQKPEIFIRTEGGWFRVKGGWKLLILFLLIKYFSKFFFPLKEASHYFLKASLAQKPVTICFARRKARRIIQHPSFFLLLVIHCIIFHSLKLMPSPIMFRNAVRTDSSS